MGQEQLGELQAAIVVGDLHPFHTHGDQLREPLAADSLEADDGRVPGAPVDADAGIALGTGVFMQFHRRTPPR